MEENEKGNQLAETSSTTKVESASPDTADIGNEDQQSSIPSSDKSPEQGEQDNDLAAKREYGKLQQVQKEMDALKRQYESVSGWIAKDPERYKQALIETSGYSDYEAEQLTKSVYPTWQNTNVQSQPQVDPVKKMAAEELLAEREAKIRKRESSIKEFLYEHPELNKEQALLVFSAGGLIERSSDGRLSPKEAIEEAYRRNFKPESIAREAEERGELRGLSQASSIASSIQSPPRGTLPQTEKEPNIPEDEWKAAQSMGFKSKSEYALYRDNDRLIIN